MDIESENNSKNVQEKEEYVEKKEIKTDNYNTVNEISKIKSCISLIRKMPVSKYKKSVEAITNLIYEEDDLLNEFLQKIDQPAEFNDKDIKGKFLNCEFNRDGDSYRSNISNTYYPKPESKEDQDALRYPVKELRDFEVILNKAFKEYTKLYYGQNAVCSCFVWELDKPDEINSSNYNDNDNNNNNEQNKNSNNIFNNGICVGIVIKNQVDGTININGGCWDSSNLIVIKFRKNENNKIEAVYTLTTTVMFNVVLNNKDIDNIGFSGSNTKMIESTKELGKHMDIQTHINVIGDMIESNEGDIRSKVEERNIKKTKEILDTARYSNILGKPNIEGAQKLKNVFVNKN